MRGSSAPASLKLAGRRVFHVTHLRTLESIVLDGELRAGVTPDVELSSATTRELRASAPVLGGPAVASFVAFSLAQSSQRWEELRDGAEGAHWSDAARAVSAAELVVLAFPVDALGTEFAFADGDAAAAGTRFAAGHEAGTQLLRRLHAHDPEFREAELLVLDAVSLDSLAIVTVANDRVRDRVREIFADAGRSAPRIAVFPPLFQPGE